MGTYPRSEIPLNKQEFATNNFLYHNITLTSKLNDQKWNIVTDAFFAAFFSADFSVLLFWIPESRVDFFSADLSMLFFWWTPASGVDFSSDDGLSSTSAPCLSPGETGSLLLLSYIYIFSTLNAQFRNK